MSEQASPTQPANAEEAAPAAESVPTIKTRFPTARIKRIMQADEEVGKVAQQTPVAVGKALELFMVALVKQSAELARSKNQKRVTPQMLKEVIENDERWDFLRDIVAKTVVEKPPAGSSSSGARNKAESDSDENEGKKRRGGRRKKSVAE
jgi:histone H3/H4